MVAAACYGSQHTEGPKKTTEFIGYGEENKQGNESKQTQVPLSGLEVRFGECQVVRALWLFNRTLNGQVLKDSLSRLLSKIPLLSGRIFASRVYKNERMTRSSSSHLSVLLCNKGVRFTEAVWPEDSPLEEVFGFGSLEGLLDSGKEPSQGLFCDLEDPRILISGAAPLFTVQHNVFPDGRSVLGVGVSHALADAYSLYRLVSDWSSVARSCMQATSGGDEAALQLDYTWDRGLLFPIDTGSTTRGVKRELRGAGVPFRGDAFTRRVLIGRALPSAMRRVADPLAPPGRLVVHFLAEEVAALRKHAGSLPAPSAERVTSNDALCAHIAQCLSRVFRFSGRTTLVFTVQLRGRTLRPAAEPTGNEGEAPPRQETLGDNYIGNPLVLAPAEIEQAPHTLTLPEVAAAIRNRILRVDEEDVPTLRLRDAGLRHKIAVGSGAAGGAGRNTVAFNCQQKMPAYSADFGGGPPALCLPGSLGDSVMLFPAPGGGILGFFFLGRSASLTRRVAAGSVRSADGADFLSLLHSFRAAA